MNGARRAIVIGASSGIGAALVGELHRRGFRTAGVARREAELRAVMADAGGMAYVGDVRDRDAAAPLFARIVDDLGGLDWIIYAAGIMPRITPETYDAGIDAGIVETNLIGAMAWLNPAARLFREQGRGRIVGISSVAGDRGRRGHPAYCASKAGLDTWLESLRNRLHRHGVRVVTIKPGYVDTAMTRGLSGLFWMAGAAEAARAIADAAEAGVRVRYVRRRWGLVGFVIRNIPSFLFRRLDI
jgi:NAD(P)-dependent dehydrogenase (short-subunit alcohol dehydrogenase family)